jgi:hypothetical protein
MGWAPVEVRGQWGWEDSECSRSCRGVCIDPHLDPYTRNPRPSAIVRFRLSFSLCTLVSSRQTITFGQPPSPPLPPMLWLLLSDRPSMSSPLALASIHDPYVQCDPAEDAAW